MTEAPHDSPAGTDNVLIRVRGLRRVYSKGDIRVVALAGIDLDVRQGEFVAVMGPSGSGKSTLMHLLGGLDQPTGGSYRLDGIELAELSDAELSRVRNRKVGLVFQTFNLLADSTARDNIALPLVYAGIGRQERYASSQVAAEAMGLGDRLTHKPGELSGGQVQRVAIARALAGNPRLILADEPTGNLDTQTGAEIMAIFHRLHRQGATLIMVTHDQKLARYADRIIQLRDGVIVTDEVVAEHTRPDEEHGEIRTALPPKPSRGHRMRWRDLIRIGVREGLWAHRMRTFLTMLGVMFGVAAVIAIVSVTAGAKIQLMKHIEAMGANTIKIQEDEEVADARTRGSEGLSQKDVDALLSVVGDYIRQIAPMKKVNAELDEKSAEVWATTPVYPEIVNSIVSEGSFFSDQDLAGSRAVCVLGHEAAFALFGGQSPIGRRVNIGRTPYDVIGVLARKPQTDENFNQHIYVPLTAALRRVKRSPGASELDRIMLGAREGEQVRTLKTLIEKILRRHHMGVQDFTVFIQEEKLEQQQKTRDVMNVVLAVMAGIALTVGGIGIMNIMLATVTERTREIGIRRAVGATQRDVLKQFLTEAVGISVVGGMVGIFLGWFGGWVITSYADLAESVFSVQAASLGFGVAVSVGLIFGIFPAWTAAKMDPIEALRYE
ncbi:MAG TPA: ABC transporter permease [Planctomycetota bacterium]|nr:ABC transporter permease [Planctomycetota bacterium]